MVVATLGGGRDSCTFDAVSPLVGVIGVPALHTVEGGQTHADEG